MRDLDRALSEINAIRSQIARETEFRGYGPTTLVATGVLALLTAAMQAFWLPEPAQDLRAYLMLWVGTAVLSAIIIAFETVTRSRRVHSHLADEMIQAAAEQFLPAAAAGALVTLVLFRVAPENLWMLPGLWQILFSLGIFASCRFLPRPLYGVGAWYLATGLACLAVARGEAAFSPWAMGVPYGIGQLLIAVILYHSNRVRDEQS